MAVFSLIGGAVATGVLGLAAGSTAATIVGTGIAAGLSVGASLVASSFLAQQQPDVPYRTAIQGQLQLGEDTLIWAAYGPDKTQGHQVYYAKWGAGNKYNAYVKRLSNGWCGDIKPYVFFYGEKHDLVSQTPVGNEDARYTVSGFGGTITLRIYHGSPVQGPDTELVAATASLDTPWSSSSVGKGIHYVVEQFEYDEDLFERGRPEITYVLGGVREYDPRKDDTVAGGLGSHRIDDASTWEPTANPAIHDLNFQLGLKGLESGRTILGMGSTLNDLDLTSFITAANICDQDRTKNGETFKRYTAGALVSSGEDFTSVLPVFQDAMAGYYFRANGLSGVVAGAPQIAAGTITDNDIRKDVLFEEYPHRPSDELYNYLTGQYTDGEGNWDTTSLDPVTVNADVTADRRERSMSYDFTQVHHAATAQSLLHIRYRQNRYGASYKFAISTRLGDQIKIGEWWAYSGREWLVTSVDKADDVCTITLAETSADIYSEDGIDPGPVSVPLTPILNPDLLSNVENFAAQAGIDTGANGQTIPTLEFSWSPPGDPTIDAVVIEYRPSDTTAATRFGSMEVEEGSHTLRDGLVAGADYDYRHTIATTPGRLTTWSPWYTIATDANAWSLPDNSIDLSKFTDAARADRDEVRAKAESALSNDRDENEIWLRAEADIANALDTFKNTQGLEQAGFKVDPENGRLTLYAIDSADNQKKTAQAILDGLNASISLRVTNTTFEGRLQDLQDAIASTSQRWEFAASEEGWTGSNTTVGQASGALTAVNTGADAYVQQSSLSFDAGDNPRVTIQIKRTTGSNANWPVGVSFDNGSGHAAPIVFPEPADHAVSSQLTLDLSGEPSWTGNVTEIRLHLGGAGEAWAIDSVEIGRSFQNSAQLAEQEARITDAELRLDANEQAIEQRVLTAEFGLLTGRLDGEGAILTVDGGLYEDLALQADLDTVITSVNSVSERISSAQGATAETETLSYIAAEQALQGFVNGFNETSRFILGLARTNQALQSYTDEETGRVEAELRTLIDALRGATEATIEALQQVVIDNDSATALSIESLSASTEASISVLEAADAANASAISDEAADRASGDAANTVAIANEAADRASGDAANASAIADETTARQIAVQVNGDAISALTVRVDQAEGNIASTVSDLTSLTAEVGTKANQSALTSGLAGKVDNSTFNQAEARLDTVENTVSTQGTNLTNLTAEVGLKADQAALTSGLSGKADQSALTSGLAVKADQSALTTGLAGKVDNSEFNLVSADLDTAENTLGLHGIRLNTLEADTSDLQSDVNARATISQLNNVSANVAAAQGAADGAQATATAAALKADQNEVQIGDISAGGLLEFNSIATVTGYSSTVDLRVSGDNGSSFNSAGLNASVAPGLSRLGLSADEVVVERGRIRSETLNDDQGYEFTEDSARLVNPEISGAVFGVAAKPVQFNADIVQFGGLIRSERRVHMALPNAAGPDPESYVDLTTSSARASLNVLGSEINQFVAFGQEGFSGIEWISNSSKFVLDDVGRISHYLINNAGVETFQHRWLGCPGPLLTPFLRRHVDYVLWEDEVGALLEAPFYVPDGAVSLDVSAIGAGGGSGDDNGFGGPGGVCQARFPIGGNNILQPGMALYAVIGRGGVRAVGTPSYFGGGRGAPDGSGSFGSGGGFTGLFYRDDTVLGLIGQQNALLIAPGGGAGCGHNRGSGGGTSVGSHSGFQSGMEGNNFQILGGIVYGAAGGGYRGGGTHGEISSNGTANERAGHGGEGFIASGATNILQTAQGFDPVATTRLPPITGGPDVLTIQDSSLAKIGTPAGVNIFGLIPHGIGQDQDKETRGGHGLMVVRFN